MNLHDKAERRLLAVELMQHGVNQTRLAEALQQARSALAFVGPAGRFHVANLRMVLVRNALIVLALVAAVVLVLVVGVREANRPTLTIAAFDVPPSLEARGLTGQVLAKALFDELIRRR